MIIDCLRRTGRLQWTWFGDNIATFFLPTLNFSQPLLANVNDLVSVPISQTEPSAVTLVINPDDVPVKRGEDVTAAAYSELLLQTSRKGGLGVGWGSLPYQHPLLCFLPFPGHAHFSRAPLKLSEGQLG